MSWVFSDSFQGTRLEVVKLKIEEFFAPFGILDDELMLGIWKQIVDFDVFGRGNASESVRRREDFGRDPEFLTCLLYTSPSPRDRG